MKKNHLSCVVFIGLLVLSTFLYRCKKPELSGEGAPATASLNAKTKNAVAAPQITSFVHPGVLNTQASLQYAADQVNGGDAGRLASYQKVLDFINSHTYPSSFPSVVVVGLNGATSPSKNQIRSDAELVYALALRWTKTGDFTYANQAIFILNGWAKNFTGYQSLNSSTTPQQPSLEASWTTPSFVAAAEIIRYGYNFIMQYLPIIIAPGGTISEYCNRMDCVHFQYSLTAFAYAAELARIQGDNSIWTANGNLLSAGYDYQRTAYGGGGGCQYCSTSSPVFPGVEVAYNYYKTGNLGYLRGLQAPLGVPNDNTFPGFTTYTHYGVPDL